MLYILKLYCRLHLSETEKHQFIHSCRKNTVIIAIMNFIHNEWMPILQLSNKKKINENKRFHGPISWGHASFRFLIVRHHRTFKTLTGAL